MNRYKYIDDYKKPSIKYISGRILRYKKDPSIIIILGEFDANIEAWRVTARFDGVKLSIPFRTIKQLDELYEPI